MAKYSKGAKKSVESAMKRIEKGTLRSGKSNKKVTNPKQAIAIGLSEARKKGAKIPSKKSATKKTAKKLVSKKAAPIKAAKKTTTKKSAVKKAATKKTVRKPNPLNNKRASLKTGVSKNKITELQKIPIASAEGTATSVEKNENNLPPVEEKNKEIAPVVNEKAEDPMIAVDKKEMAKAVTKEDPNHPMQLSQGMRPIRPSGKKPLWRK